MRANGKMIRPYWPKSTLNISADTGCHLCARMLGVIAGWRSTVVDMLDPTWRCSYYSVVWNFSKGKPAGRTLEMYCDIPEVTDRRVGDIPMSEWKKENKVYFKIWDFEGPFNITLCSGSGCVNGDDLSLLEIVTNDLGI